MRFVNNVKTAFLLGSLMALCMLIGHYFGGPNGLLIGLLLGGTGNLLAFFFSDKIALAAHGAQPLDRDQFPWLYDMVANLSARADLPMPRLYLCPQAAPNAFATGRGPASAAVAITEGMLRSFPPQEIEAVMAHELGHVKHRDMLIATIAATMAGVISYASYMLMWVGGGGDRRDNPLGAIGALLMIILAPIAAALIQMAISRQREYAADSFAGELVGDPLRLASALARLGNLNQRIPTQTSPAFESLHICQSLSAGGLMSLFSTHPPIEKRIEALERQAMQMR
jgi:heat shock protein HtpX